MSVINTRLAVGTGLTATEAFGDTPPTVTLSVTDYASIAAHGALGDTAHDLDQGTEALNLAEVQTGYVYFGASDTNGSWRIRPSGTDLLIERRESGSWVAKTTITP